MEKELKKILSILIAMMLSVSLMACGKAAEARHRLKKRIIFYQENITLQLQCRIMVILMWN